MAEIALDTPADFNFRNTVFSHGWCSLSPFSVEEEPLILRRTIRRVDGRNATCAATRGDQGSVLIVSMAGRMPAAVIRHDISAQFAAMLHFDCNLAAFYRRMRQDSRHGWMARRKAGRFLRGATFFEDVVKTILTTNCSWANTQAMNESLIASIARAPDSTGHAFPAPEAIADTSERFLREHAKLGYRAPFILELSRRCVRREVHLEGFRHTAAPAAELYRELRSIKGVGDYAAGNLLRLLGRFDYLGLDSWCRAKFSELHGNGAPVKDAEIERHYAEFDEWKGLVMWLDLTRHWYTKKFPL